MPITLEFDEGSGLCLSTATEVVNSDEIDAHIRIVVQHPSYRMGCAKLCDFRNARLKLAPNAIGQMKHLLADLREDLRSGKWAIVVSEDFAYGIGRMFSILGSFSRIDIRVFRDVYEAKEWLGHPTVLEQLV